MVDPCEQSRDESNAPAYQLPRYQEQQHWGQRAQQILNQLNVEEILAEEVIHDSDVKRVSRGKSHDRGIDPPSIIRDQQAVSIRYRGSVLVIMCGHRPLGLIRSVHPARHIDRMERLDGKGAQEQSQGNENSGPYLHICACAERDRTPPAEFEQMDLADFEA